ncbi:MAG: AbrB/MazE/SpoVT family DNA-binding domain-containing protein [Oscillospiraceae bacterium]|nr:AbrB/MazE/SpoVT family DNA-binding domain-containing protein [Oscillospiraceae bacterium]
MKATGIVRRIDELGRVVIPKEIRRTMRIREGDPLEIYTDREGEVIFKKYSPIGELANFATLYADSLSKTCDMMVIVCDRDAVIAVGGLPEKDYLDKRISSQAEEAMVGRKLFTYRPDANFEMTAEVTGYFVSCLMPIVVNGDIHGCVASVFPAAEKGSRSVSETESKLIQTAASFLGTQLD